MSRRARSRYRRRVSIRILLAHMPGLLHDVLARSLAAEPDLELVGDDATASLPLPPDASSSTDAPPVGDAPHPVGGHPLGVELARTRPDVLVLGLYRDEPPDVCAEVLSEFPRLKVIALEGMGMRASVHELRPTYAPLGAVSPAEIVAAIRCAARTAPHAAPHAALAERGAGGPAEDAR